MWKLFVACLFFVFAVCGCSHAASVLVLSSGTTEGEESQWFSLSEEGSMPMLRQERKVPLGSVWKLFVYGYLTGTNHASPNYQCTGRSTEEVYCCEAGGQIDREQALMQSCGLFFDPVRLKIDAADWARFWQKTPAPHWLYELKNVREDFKVSPEMILSALDAFPESVQRISSQALLGVVLQPKAGQAFDILGTLLRPKTWTMPDPGRPSMRIGGAAGWFASGRSFWLGGEGAGIEVVRKAAPSLEGLLVSDAVPDDAMCVDVRFFKRYPLSSVIQKGKSGQVPAGVLRGQFLARFKNGQRIPIESQGETLLSYEQKIPVLRARLGMNEYVARVLDREAAPVPEAAAKALSIVVRTFLVQNAIRQNGCYQIDDSSALQRVSPRPASVASRRIADMTSDLMLHEPAVRYHLNKTMRGVLNWSQAVKEANQGWGVRDILLATYPNAALGGMDIPGHQECMPVPVARDWLLMQLPKWRSKLFSMTGYVEPDELPIVCLTNAVHPFSDSNQHRLYVQGWSSQEDRTSLVHEYLHLAFDGYPASQNEVFIEKLARQLVLGISP